MAALALSKAQATQVYAGLGLWPAAVTAKLVEAQLTEDGTYPNAAAVFAKGADATVADFDSNQPRAPDGRWTAGGPTTPSSAWESGATEGAGVASKRTAPSEPSGILGVLGMLNPIGTAHAAGLG